MTITREQIIAWARETWLGDRAVPLFADGDEFAIDIIQLEYILRRAEQAVRADENEQCAKVCDHAVSISPTEHAKLFTELCADAIRARRNT